LYIIHTVKWSSVVSVHLSLVEKPRPAAIASLSDPLAAFDKVDPRPDAKKTKTLTDVLMIACCGISQLADFHFERTGLYLSLRSQWFLAGQGGACSHTGVVGRSTADVSPAKACGSFLNPKLGGSWNSTTAPSNPSSNPRKAER
jgi:hypothetical protein